MNRRVRTMSDELNVRGTYILDTFNEYLKGVFWVNRKYQRKLVWTLEEKQSFIDTILHNYPVPIFLLAKYKLGDEAVYRKDIIDGLQRLNAIFSFIKNEFAVKDTDGQEYYFNVDALAASEQMIKEGILVQRGPKFDYDTCRRFLNYQLPITTTEVSDSEIEDIFVRINATGRKLSKQDLRQAGAVGYFSDLVRKTACYIRGDITETDIIPLAKMPTLSLSNKKLPYHININETFWIKHNILTENNIRISRDEEIIARLYSYMILGDGVSPSSEALNEMYNTSSVRNVELNKAVEERGVTDLMDSFSKTYSDLVKVFNIARSTFSAWLFKNREIKGKSKIFQAIFLSLYELRSEMFVITDYVAVAKALHGIGDKEFREVTHDGEWNKNVRNNMIRRVKSVLQPLMVKKVHTEENDEWKYKLEILLTSACGVEAQMYDFKLGFTTLTNGQRNDEVLFKAVKTLTAMVNTQPTKCATIVIGVANDLNSAEDFKRHYKCNWVQVAECYVTGVDAEIKKHWKNRDEYFDYIKNTIEKAPVSEEVKSRILCNFHPVSYEDRTIVMLTLDSLNKPVDFDRKMYERHGSHNVEVPIGSTEFYVLLDRFKNM